MVVLFPQVVSVGFFFFQSFVFEVAIFVKHFLTNIEVGHPNVSFLDIVALRIAGRILVDVRNYFDLFVFSKALLFFDGRLFL